MLIVLLKPHTDASFMGCHVNVLKQYKGRESIPVSDVACVVQSVHTVEQYH